MYTYIYTYIYIYIEIYIHTYLHMCIYIYIDLHTYIYTYVFISRFTYIHIHMYIYIYMYLYNMNYSYFELNKFGFGKNKSFIHSCWRCWLARYGCETALVVHCGSHLEQGPHNVESSLHLPAGLCRFQEGCRACSWFRYRFVPAFFSLGPLIAAKPSRSRMMNL